MKFSLDKHLDVDLQYIFGSKWNVNAEDLQNYEAVISNAAKRVQRIRKTGKGPGGKAVLFSRLPYILDENVLMTAEERLRLERLDGIGKEQDVLISIGIGGSYLGNQAILIFLWSVLEYAFSQGKKRVPAGILCGTECRPGSAYGSRPPASEATGPLQP